MICGYLPWLVAARHFELGSWDRTVPRCSKDIDKSSSPADCPGDSPKTWKPVRMVETIWKTPGWWFQPLWKILVNGDDYSQSMGKKCSKPATSLDLTTRLCKWWPVRVALAKVDTLERWQADLLSDLATKWGKSFENTRTTMVAGSQL